jgi:Lipocalin-like domain
MHGQSDVSAALVGAWKLLRAQFEFADSGESIDLFGSDPVGRLILTGSGDMMTILTSTGRVPANDQVSGSRLFETMMAYAGKFHVDGDKLVISCDLAWHPAWVGTEQVRFFTLDRDKLFIRSGKQTHPKHPGRLGYGVIEWCRE